MSIMMRDFKTFLFLTDKYSDHSNMNTDPTDLSNMFNNEPE